MNLQVVVKPAEGKNSAHVEIQTEQGVVVSTLKVSLSDSTKRNPLFATLNVTTSLFDGDEHVFKRSVSDLAVPLS